jgi:uncharacterized protein YndB with AHSA1/START domain
LADYSFVTHWHFDAPVEKVWDAVFHSERWPGWWKGAESVVELTPGDPSGVGSVRQFVWKSALPYRLAFEVETVRVEPLSLLEGRVREGDLEGKGVWHFQADGTGTFVRYDWNVRTTKRWMNLAAPLAGPLFRWNHDVVMRWGERGLRRLLEGYKPV